MSDGLVGLLQVLGTGWRGDGDAARDRFPRDLPPTRGIVRSTRRFLAPE
ncbi:hypothetical protein STRIP9103_06655 [Streptomyces ipomoeae 91-03]|uniref:Uncharacterized protein n=1 Tax=Streptomyces ipomoeae 91-03 TaxID=698759 RepID=L1L4J1_9ACTN|nr:hypothetical protein STRIP9103_06655 [Streptomyces ipomoeae 91-03]